ncbi:hypothetical protein [Actinophytocola sp. NPDC049390]|uniref:hypothetical protein n=1 Tax=Actinophytocola sp. NPDC049390 TaxID=3363894 RepID=UPI0037A28759
MKTLLDVLDNVRIAPSSTEYMSGGRVAFKKKSRLRLPGERDLVLPSDPDGLSLVVDQQISIDGLSAGVELGAKLELLRSPAIALSLAAPTDEHLRTFGLRPDSFRREEPRRVSTFLGLNFGTIGIRYGFGRFLVVENAIRMGSSSVAHADVRWTSAIDELEEWLLQEFCLAKPSSVLIGPEPGSSPWKTVTILLGGPGGRSQSIPADWKRQAQLAAGLRRVNLDVRVNPDLTRSNIIRELRTAPPSALLVWAGWVSSPEAYIDPYLIARPSAVAEILGSSSADMTFEDTKIELMLHLREIEPLNSTRTPIKDWKQFAQAAELLRSDYFHLTERARSMMEKNRYRFPERMFDHLERLSRLAYDFRASDGKVSGRIAEVGRTSHGIEIALFDSSLSGTHIVYEGARLDTVPHVKVDDAKREPDKCGRIYFAIDSTNLRFVVDHIGIHDYG